MGVLNIRPVKRGGSKVILGFAGPSGTGKTYTALQVARGMVNSPSEIGFLDTENKRGSLYADILDGAFMIGDLYAPFSPQRYSDAIKEFQEAGVKVLVIDSISHEWEGDGGCEDIANAPILAGKRMADWKKAKSEHKKFMNTLLFCDMHIICCIRAREKTDFKNPSMPVSLGIQPICEKNFMFELTASVLLEDEGKSQKHLKVPSFLLNYFGDGKTYLTKELGKSIMKWVDGGEKEDSDITKIRSEMLMACENGLQAVERIWDSLSIDMKTKMKPYMDTIKESAKAYDSQEKESSNVENNVDEQKCIKLLEDASSSLQLLGEAWTKLSIEEKANPVVLAKKEELKQKINAST